MSFEILTKHVYWNTTHLSLFSQALVDWNTTGVCGEKPFRRALAMQPSHRNCCPTPDLLIRKLVFLCVLFFGGVFCSQTAAGNFASQDFDVCLRISCGSFAENCGDCHFPLQNDRRVLRIFVETTNPRQNRYYIILYYIISYHIISYCYIYIYIYTHICGADESVPKPRREVPKSRPVRFPRQR